MTVSYRSEAFRRSSVTFVVQVARKPSGPWIVHREVAGSILLDCHHIAEEAGEIREVAMKVVDLVHGALDRDARFDGALVVRFG